MTGNELLRRLRRLARRNQMTLLYEGRPGKGGHGRIYLGERFTTIPALTHEIPPGPRARVGGVAGTPTTSKVLRDLGPSRRDLA